MKCDLEPDPRRPGDTIFAFSMPCIFRVTFKNSISRKIESKAFCIYGPSRIPHSQIFPYLALIYFFLSNIFATFSRRKIIILHISEKFFIFPHCGNPIDQKIFLLPFFFCIQIYLRLLLQSWKWKKRNNFFACSTKRDFINDWMNEFKVERWRKTKWRMECCGNTVVDKFFSFESKL